MAFCKRWQFPHHHIPVLRRQRPNRGTAHCVVEQSPVFPAQNGNTKSRTRTRIREGTYPLQNPCKFVAETVHNHQQNCCKSLQPDAGTQASRLQSMHCARCAKSAEVLRMAARVAGPYGGNMALMRCDETWDGMKGRGCPQPTQPLGPVRPEIPECLTMAPASLASRSARAPPSRGVRHMTNSRAT
eukprot:gene10566-biopygen9348